MQNKLPSTLPVGVCVAPVPPPNRARTVNYPRYIHEILRHAGVCYQDVAPELLPDTLDHLRLLVTVGELELEDSVKSRVAAWVEAGGAWLAIGSVCGMPDVFGAQLKTPSYAGWGVGTGTLGEGYLHAASPTHPIVAGLRIPLHFFNGIPAAAGNTHVLATVSDAHQRPTTRTGVTEKNVGRGRAVLVAPDVTGAVVRIQQGTAITRDGVPSDDGAAPRCDGILKSDDGAVLDWHFDRQPVENVAGLQAFLEPIADQWRELVLRAVFYLAERQQVPLPVLWLYPRDLPAIGHISHDTDGNDPGRAKLLLQTLEKADIRSTWCTIPPGYAQETMEGIRARGHELAMHYDAISEGRVWNESAFDQQWGDLTALFGGVAPTTNKNHYLRWEGDTEFFQWCGRRGIQLDQSKGPSKPGQAGFLFGTCHPHLPVAPNGSSLDVLELPTLTQDLVVFVPPAFLSPLLEAALRHHGILHLLFHPAHIDKPGVEEALLESVEAARRAGMEWWTAEQINLWERARRTVEWTGRTTSGGVTFQASQPLPEATLLWLSNEVRAATINGRSVTPTSVVRWGFQFSGAQLDVAPGIPYSFAFD
ncbi:MAG: hypothetical protein HY706_01355 [Candidatus Hydrogenedentes bacterium]|nr:hypothetical protein [Candidatus Hydrogenedentota bacterium]